MNKHKIVYALPRLAVFAAALAALAAPPRLFAETVTDERIVADIGYFAEKAGVYDRYDKSRRQSPSRLDWARFFNDVAWRLEAARAPFSADEERRFDAVVKYFDKEYLLINLSAAVEEKPRLKLGAEFSVNTDYVWGEDVATSVLALSQQLRLSLEAKNKNAAGRLALRNFGFWGVNEYSSGSVGINFKTSDPPFVDELYVESFSSPKLSVGRRYFKYGIWGLAANRIYTPLDSAEISYSAGNFSAAVTAAAQYENADYYAAALSVETRSFVAGAAAALFDASAAALERAGGAENDSAASLYGRASVLPGITLAAESAVYKKNPSAETVTPVVSEAAYKSADVDFAFRWARIPDMKFPSYSVARPPLDYIDKDYIGTRFISKTKGYNAVLALKYASPLVAEIEQTWLEGISENLTFAKSTARLIYTPRKSGGLSLVAEISASALDSADKDYREWRALSQAAFRF